MGKMKGGPVRGSLPATSVVRVDLPASLRWLRMRPAAVKRVVMRVLNGRAERPSFECSRSLYECFLNMVSNRQKRIKNFA